MITHEKLRGLRISLVPLSIKHARDFARYCGDASLWVWWLRKPPLTLEGITQEIELALTQQKEGRRISYSIFHQECQEYIGSTSFLNIDIPNRSLEIGATWLAKPFQQTGINGECKTLLLAHAFEVFGMQRVALQTDELNLPARRAIEKLGAKLEGILRHHRLVWNGRVRSTAIYSILAQEWKAR